jgi:methanogenic corrinoid protein MtbC1
VLDQVLALHGPDVAMRDVIFPCLRELGHAWERAELDVGQEHFASSLIQRRLLALVPGWDEGHGPRAVLACAPGERHSLGLTGFGVGLRNRGWRVTYLGADTPVGMVARAADKLSPQLVVISSTMAHARSTFEEDLRTVATSFRLALAGAGVSPAVAERAGAEFLEGDPVTVAQRLAAA